MIKKGLLVYLVFALFSCAQAPVFEGNVQMERNIWNRFNFLMFEVPVTENELLDFDLMVGYTEEYPWDELITNITFYPPDGSMLSSDYTFKPDKKALTDVTGKSQEFSIRKQMKFGASGICKVRVENKMSKVQTPGISSVGISARRSE
jgi:gliding motility-associated lipoprotein GldH